MQGAFRGPEHLGNVSRAGRYRSAFDDDDFRARDRTYTHVPPFEPPLRGKRASRRLRPAAECSRTGGGKELVIMAGFVSQYGEPCARPKAQPLPWLTALTIANVRPFLGVGHQHTLPKTMSATHSSLVDLADAEGSVRVGWVANGVLYARFERGMSADLGARFAAQLHELVAETSGVRYFGDARALTHYDLLARSAFVRMALANRRKFTAFVMLTWPSGVNHAAKNIASTLGGSVELLVDAEQFDVRLSAAAPFAKRVIEPKSTSTRELIRG